MREARFPAANVKRRSDDDKHEGEGVITWQKMGEAVSLLEIQDMWTYCIHTGRQREAGAAAGATWEAGGVARGETNKTPRPSLPSIHLLSSWCLLLHWMRTDSAVTEGKKTLQCSGALDLDNSTQAAKCINLATVEKPNSRHWSISEEVCCIIRAGHVGYTLPQREYLKPRLYLKLLIACQRRIWGLIQLINTEEWV